MTAPSTEPWVNTIKRHGAAMDELRDIFYELRSMASAAAAIGLESQSKMFFSLATDIENARHEADEAFRDEFKDHCETVNQGTANMLGAVMALCSEKGK